MIRPYIPILCFLAFCSAANAELLHRDQARWRLELAGWNGISLGTADRDDEQGLSFAVEREVPLSKRWTASLKVHPLWVYDESSADTTVYGAAAGVHFRTYFKKNVLRGAYLEGGASILLQSDKFSGNSTQWNFMTEAGLGYQFKKGVSISAKYRHISNAGLGDENRGVDTLGIAVGYAFKPH